MPNWCLNKLTLEHDEAAMIQQAARAFNEGALLNFFIPCPLELLDDDLESYGGQPTEAEAKENKRAAMAAKYGYQSWYDWSLANWGCKWDVFFQQADQVDLPVNSHSLTLSFETPWSPPIEALQAAEAKGFRVRLYYYEPGLNFAGSYEDGMEDYHDDAESPDGQFFISRLFPSPEPIPGQEVHLG